MGFGEGRGKLFFRKVPSPFPKFPLFAQYVADAEDARFVEILADELHTDREAAYFRPIQSTPFTSLLDCPV